MPALTDRSLPSPGSKAGVAGTHRRIGMQPGVIPSLVLLSVCLIDCGWNPDDRLTVVPICTQNSLQKADTNCGPWSDTTSTGMPCSRNTCCKMTCTVSLAKESFRSGTDWVNLLNQSMIVSITVFSLDGGNPVMKSNENVRQRSSLPLCLPWGSVSAFLTL